jgi:hypothetical protein
MLCGSSTLGSVPLAGSGYAAIGGLSYVDLAGSITATSGLSTTLSVTGVGNVHLAGLITISSAVTSSITITAPVTGTVNIAATITMLSDITSSLVATQTFPNPGVSFQLSDKAGGY